MPGFPRRYRAILSSDWNECLAPCGPFDFIFFNFPDLREGLTAIFRQYTTNVISLGEAVRRMRAMLPRPVGPDEIDAYLDASFAAYPDLSAWIDWCLSHEILFMINTTGMVGYFQRLFAKALLPRIPALSAHPMIRYDALPSDPLKVLELLEIQDKPRNTEAAIRSFGLKDPKIIVMGDSGGDGPHFEWGAKVGALLIGSMIKPSLQKFCEAGGISIHVAFGRAEIGDAPVADRQTPGLSLMELVPILEEWLAV
ncbi:MAG: hypothetical protein AB9873_11750 [Syntrophobacteraceae bacterium]